MKTIEINLTIWRIFLIVLSMFVGIVSGMSSYLFTKYQLSQIPSTIIEAVRKKNFAGVSFFFYESLWKWGKEPENIRNQSLKEIFKNNISRPDMSG